MNDYIPRPIRRWGPFRHPGYLPNKSLQVAHGPPLRAAAAPVTLIIDQVGGHSQRQVRRQVVQDLLLMLWEQLLQDGVVFGSKNRQIGGTVLGTLHCGTLGSACLSGGTQERERPSSAFREPQSVRRDSLHSQGGPI